MSYGRNYRTGLPDKGSSGTGGAVDSVNGQTGVVVLDATDVGAISSTAIADTYANIDAMRVGATLIPEQMYKITDYATVRTGPDGYTGVNEPLYIWAMTTSTFYPQAVSETNPNDIILYDFTGGVSLGFTMGKIIYRINTTRDIIAHDDFLNYESRLWEESPGAGVFYLKDDPGNGATSQMFPMFAAIPWSNNAYKNIRIGAQNNNHAPIVFMGGGSKITLGNAFDIAVFLGNVSDTTSGTCSSVASLQNCNNVRLGNNANIYLYGPSPSINVEVGEGSSITCTGSITRCIFMPGYTNNGTYVLSGDHSDEIIGAVSNYVPMSVLNDIKDPTGWVDPTTVDVAYNVIDDTVTLTGNLDYYWRGQLKSLTSPWTSDPHDSATGVSYFLSSTDGINFTWSTTPWDFSDLMVAYIQHGATDLFGIREPHSTMPWQSHEDAHRTHGTYRQSGGDLSGWVAGSTVAADRRPSVSDCIVHDEDIETTILALADNGPYTVSSLTGTGATSFALGAADIVPLSTNQPYYNSFSGTWGQTLMTANQYMCVWLIAVPTTSDSDSQAYRYIWMQGQSEGTLASQQALFPQDLDLGSLETLATEFCFIAKIIIRYFAANWQITSVTNLTGSRAISVGSPAGVYLSSVSTDATLTGDGTVGNPLSVVAGPGGASAKQTTVSMGSTPIYSKTVTVTDVSVSGTSKILASLVRESDEVEFSGVACAAGTPSAGSFPLTVFSTDGPTSGDFKVNYIVG